jgi:omega-6 fatty acid desaturase (delta-12 desaturase)
MPPCSRGDASYWLTLIIAVPAAGFLARQHNCGHGAFFRGRWANDRLGRAIGVVTLAPYDHWRRSDAIHHASSGNLERRGTGDIERPATASQQPGALGYFPSPARG